MATVKRPARRGHIKVREQSLRLPSGTQTTLTIYLLKNQFVVDKPEFVGYMEGYEDSFQGVSESEVHDKARGYLKSLENPEAEKIIRIFWDYGTNDTKSHAYTRNPGVLIAMDYFVLMKVTTRVNFAGQEKQKVTYYSPGVWKDMLEDIKEGHGISTTRGNSDVKDPWFGSINPHDSGDVPWSAALEASLEDLQNRLILLGQTLSTFVTDIDKMKEIGETLTKMLPAGNIQEDT